MSLIVDAKDNFVYCGLYVSGYFGHLGVGLYLMVFGGIIKIIYTSLLIKVSLWLIMTILKLLLDYLIVIRVQWIVSLVRFEYGSEPIHDHPI